MRHVSKKFVLVGLAVGAMAVLAVPATANAGISVSFGIGWQGNCRPYCPPPVVYVPAPSYYYPPPVYYVPAPQYYYSPGYYVSGGGHWRHHGRR